MGKEVRINTNEFETEWNARQDEHNIFFTDAKRALERERTKSNSDLQLVHESLKTNFKDRGLYCGTMEQFETYKKGQGAAAWGVAKGAAKVAKGLFAPTAKGSTGVFA